MPDQDAHASAVFLTFLAAVVFSLQICSIQREDNQPTLCSPEAVLEPPRNVLEVAHAASSGGLSPLGLLAPLVRPQLGRGVAALRTGCSHRVS